MKTKDKINGKWKNKINQVQYSQLWQEERLWYYNMPSLLILKTIFHSDDVFLLILVKVYLLWWLFFLQHITVVMMQLFPNLSRIWSFMIEILLLNLVFHSGVSLFSFFQCFITETSAQSYILKLLSISYPSYLYIKLIVTL